MMLSSEKRRNMVRSIVKTMYEKGNQKRSKRAIYRGVVRKVYGISERTFWRYINEN